MRYIKHLTYTYSLLNIISYIPMPFQVKSNNMEVEFLKMLFPAHIHPTDKTVQSCTEHLRKAAQYAGQALKSINLYSSAYLAGLVHDQGKFKSQYKEYLEASSQGDDVRRGSVIHTFAGTRYLLQYHTLAPDGEPTYKDIISEILAYAVGAHHGLFDCVNEQHESGFLHRFRTIPEGDHEAVRNFHEQCADENEINTLFDRSMEELTPFLDKCDDCADSDDEWMFLYGLLVRLLTSAVMEGDRRDTAEFMSGSVYPPEADRILWQNLLVGMEAKLNTLDSSSPINAARRKISDICREAAGNHSGVYRLNVPTGGGKTLSALRYALAHAAEHNKKRIIFTFPLLSILEQNCDIIKKFVEGDFVLEHHSNVVQEKISPEKLDDYELLTETWSSSIIVTTLVQLLNTMFDGKTSSIRRFHALSDAVIVIDEVQTVPGNMLTLFNLAITFLAEFCNTTILLCSATQPCLEEMDHPIRTSIEDIVPYDTLIWEVFRRTEIRPVGSFRMADIPAYADKVLADTNSLLIVCNKKSESEFIYHAVKDGRYNVFHLSAAMCMAHRRKTLSDIQQSLQHNDRKTVCVATQVIEAGVDISFGAVIRLTAGLDSIIQSAGRCNRNGESDTPAPVYIVRPLDESLNHLTDIRLAQQATESLLDAYERAPEKYGSALSSEEAVRFYYNRLFRNQSGTNAKYHEFATKQKSTIFDLLSSNSYLWNAQHKTPYFLCQAFDLAGKLFEVFDSDTTDVIVPWGDGENIITDLSSERAKHDMNYVRKLLIRAKNYTVSLYSYQKKKLEECGAIHPHLDGAILSLDPLYYDKDTGVQINTEKEVHSECDIQIW